MQRLETCSSCQGFVDQSAAACPHCDAARTPRRNGAWAGRLVKGMVAAMAGAGFAATLQACYGCPDASCGVTDSGTDVVNTDASDSATDSATDTGPGDAAVDVMATDAATE